MSGDWLDTLPQGSDTFLKYEKPTFEELMHHGTIAKYQFEYLKSLLGYNETRKLFKLYNEDRGTRKEFRALYQLWKTEPVLALESPLLKLVCQSCLRASDIVLLPCGHGHTCSDCLDLWQKCSGGNKICGYCIQPYRAKCDIKWLTEDPEETFERMQETKRAMRCRNRLRKKVARERRRKALKMAKDGAIS